MIKNNKIRHRLSIKTPHDGVPWADPVTASVIYLDGFFQIVIPGPFWRLIHMF